MKKRIGLHILFWLTYTLAYAYLNTAFAGAPSDLKYDLPIRFLRFWANELIMLPIKLLLTYGFLYIIIPRFILKRKYIQAFFATLLLVIPLVVCSRLLTFYVASPALYGDFPTFQTLSFRRLFYSFLDIGSATAVAATIKLLKGKLESERREQALIREKLQSELNFLRAQTNPHFLFNTLNNIYALARKQSNQTAPVVLKLSQLLRFMLYECNKPQIPISDELKIIEDYIDLERLRYGNRLEVNIEQSIDDPRQMIAPLLLLPFVENAFKYGASESRFEVRIDMKLYLENEQLSFKISNTYDRDKQVSGEGIGLSNVQRQLELIYPDQHRLTIKEKEQQFSVELLLNLSVE